MKLLNLNIALLMISLYSSVFADISGTGIDATTLEISITPPTGSGAHPDYTVYGPGNYNGSIIFTGRHAYCAPTKFENLEDKHFCRVETNDLQRPPVWKITSYKSRCYATCTN